MTELNLTVGMPAPDFTLKSSPNAELLSLSSLRGKPVVLAFYPADWSGICGEQLSLYNEILPEFEHYGAQLLGISVDSHHCHKAYANSKNLGFPLLADFHPKAAVSQTYDSYNEETGMSLRNLFVIDGEGIIRWTYRTPPGMNPGAKGILDALEALSQGEEPQP
ncbi:MAG: redoxin domain-containing protein [Thermomicrobiales bacterium]|nr:redoxin domain-containing protein [Thermomicrobiales bacterium]